MVPEVMWQSNAPEKLLKERFRISTTDLSRYLPLLPQYVIIFSGFIS